MAEKKQKKITVQAKDRKITYKTKENGKADTWRPDKINDDVIAKLIQAFHVDCTMKEACAYAGIDFSTFWRRRQTDLKFRKKMEDAMLFPFYKAKSVLFNSMDSEREDIAQRWAAEYLKRREPRYKDKVESSVDMELDANVDQKIDLKTKSMIDLEEMRKWLLGFK